MRVSGGGIEEEIGEVQAQYDPAPARHAVWQLAGLLVFGLTLFAGLTFWALRRLLLNQLIKPVAGLIAQADPERANLTLPEHAPAEIADLATAIGGLRERIGRHLAEAEDAAQTRNEALRRLCSEQRLAAVGQIAGEVAHELNTPLSNILGYAQSALPLAVDPELRDSLETIEAQARRAGQIVRDMLTAARAPAPSLQTLDLTALCAAFVRLVTPLARKQGCALALEADEPVSVRADAARVEQVLFNLVFNAVQAGAREVCLDVATGTKPGISVRDDGPGLPESVRARLFEPFVTTKPMGQGTGLGLAISQRLAREMGAELIWIDAGPGCLFQLIFQAPNEDLAP
jgi:signal transduction histidine kinase